MRALADTDAVSFDRDREVSAPRLLPHREREFAGRNDDLATMIGGVIVITAASALIYNALFGLVNHRVGVLHRTRDAALVRESWVVDIFYHLLTLVP